MSTPLRERLAQFLYVVAAGEGLVVALVPWLQLHGRERDRWRSVAIALLASEEWLAREAVVEAATRLDAAIYALKRESELHADEVALHDALARLAESNAS